MIQKMRKYSFIKYSPDLDEYGQPTLSEQTGEILMFISITKHSPIQNPLYVDSEYTGLTTEEIDDSFIINYNGEKLKVLYVVKGRYNQVFLKRTT